jgi:O-methyltransferase
MLTINRIKKSTKWGQFHWKGKGIFKKFREFTMIPEKTYIGNLRLCNEFRLIEGCVVECGVWRGGMSAGISEVLGPNRRYVLFDSFEGLPEPKDLDGKAARDWTQDKNSPSYYENCRAEISFAKRALEKAKTPNVEFIEGWFSDTLKKYKFQEEIAVLRLDGDWYDSTMECLTVLYPHVAEGGLIIIDDYFAWEGCSKAVHDFLSAGKRLERIRESFEGVAYMVKASMPEANLSGHPQEV